MRLLFAALGLVALATGCASPAPPATPTTPAATPPATIGATPLTAEPTDTPTPFPTMAAFSDPYPAPQVVGAPQPAWAVVASWDGTRTPHRITSTGRAKAGALIDVAFACEQATQITIHATDARTGDPVVTMSAPCRPGQLGEGSFGPMAGKTTVNFDSASIDPPVRFWVKIAAPKDHYLP